MILTIILFIVCTLVLIELLFILCCIAIPFTTGKTKIKESFIFSKFEHNFLKLSDNEQNKIAEKPAYKAVINNHSDEDYFESTPLINYWSHSCKVIYKSFDSDKLSPQVCLGMGDCILSCEQEAIKIVNNRAVINSNCSGCGKCVKVCPKKLISLVEKETTNTKAQAKKHFKMWQYCYKMIVTKKN